MLAHHDEVEAGVAGRAHLVDVLAEAIDHRHPGGMLLGDDQAEVHAVLPDFSSGRGFSSGRSFGWGGEAPDAGGSRSPSRKRVQRSGARSQPAARPSRTSSAMMSPTAGACLNPWPLQPNSAQSPAHSGVAPATGSWAGGTPQTPRE